VPVPESECIPDVDLTTAIAVPIMTKNKAHRLCKKEIGVSTFTVEQAKTTLLTFVCNVNGHSRGS
jgi:hypothetical protein